jgi:thiaminase
MYSSEEFAGLARHIRSLADGIAAGAGAAQKADMAEAYRTSLRFELGFWDMAQTLEGWRV